MLRLPLLAVRLVFGVCVVSLARLDVSMLYWTIVCAIVGGKLIVAGMIAFAPDLDFVPNQEQDVLLLLMAAGCDAGGDTPTTLLCAAAQFVAFTRCYYDRHCAETEMIIGGANLSVTVGLLALRSWIQHVGGF